MVISVYSIKVKTIEKVRFVECDSMNIVHHSNYFIWLENARFAIMDKIGINPAELEEDELLCPVIEIYGKYVKSAKFQEILEVEATLSLQEEDVAILQFDYVIRNKINRKKLFKGYTKHAILYKGKNLYSIPTKIKEKLLKFLEE